MQLKSHSENYFEKKVTDFFKISDAKPLPRNSLAINTNNVFSLLS